MLVKPSNRNDKDRARMAGKRILVVDDQESMRQMLSDLLELMGHEPRAVEGGESALVDLRARGADLVITDLNMPIMDGMELMKQIKSEFPGTPVIIITGYGSFHTEKQVLSNGADGYIPKPCTIHRVQQTVNQALGVAP
jgi:DNA-binding NtrC family response regulator